MITKQLESLTKEEIEWLYEFINNYLESGKEKLKRGKVLIDFTESLTKAFPEFEEHINPETGNSGKEAFAKFTEILKEGEKDMIMSQNIVNKIKQLKEIIE